MRGVILALFIILLAAAVFFSEERILFLDASYILFRIINLDEFQIQEYRYGSFITQMVPLYAARFGLPLNWIIILYSASFNLFYLIVISLLLFRYRNISLAILMSFYYLLFVSDTWFWTNNEVHQGIAWMFLFFGTVNYLVRKESHPAIRLAAFIILCFLSIFTHPLVIFPALFLWLFFLLQKEYINLSKLEIITHCTILLTICIIKFYLSASGDSYDSGKLHATTHISFKKVIGVFSSPMIKMLIKETIRNYWLIPIIFITGLYFGIKQNRLKPVLLTIGFCMLYVIALGITFNDFISFYTESELMPLSIIAATPFTYYFLSRISSRQAILILIFIISVRLTYIALASGKFIERREWIDNTLMEMRERNLTKVIIYENPINQQKLFMNWGSPTESMIASALAGDNPQRTFLVASPDEAQRRITQDPKQIISCFELWHYNDLNNRYFRLDTTANYSILNSRK